MIQQTLFQLNNGALATGATVTVGIVPYSAKLASGVAFAEGLSNAPTLALDVTRFNVAGVTTITGLTTDLTVLGATIPQGFTVSIGATMVTLQAGDTIHLRAGGTNAATTKTNVTLVLQALQNVVRAFSA